MISNLGMEGTIGYIRRRLGRTTVIYCCTLNELMMADDDREFGNILRRGDLLTPDGMPLVWWLKSKTGKGERVYGPELMSKLLISNFKFQIRMMFVGDEKNKEYFLKYGEYVVMPMKDKFVDKDYEFLVDSINKSKAEIVWLGLGARKQVETAAELKRRDVKKVIITVGAAFDFLSGNKKQAPKWLRNNGGEWLFRLFQEPRRLLVRYLKISFFLVRLGYKSLMEGLK